jgi:hypothetical protein
MKERQKGRWDEIPGAAWRERSRLQLLDECLLFDQFKDEEPVGRRLGGNGGFRRMSSRSQRIGIVHARDSPAASG